MNTLISLMGASGERRPIFAGDNAADLNAVAIGSGAAVITASASTKKVRIVALEISLNAAASVLFQTVTSSNTVYRTPALLADTPYTMVLGNGFGVLASEAGNIKATSSATASVTGTIWYTEE